MKTLPKRNQLGLVHMLVAVAVLLDGRTAADIACSLPEGPGLLAPKIDVLPSCVSSRCSDKQRWSSGHKRKGAGTAVLTERMRMRSGRDVVLPDEFSIVADALEAAKAGDRVFFREGRFAWQDMAVVREHMHIAGDDKSCLLGPWLLQTDSTGLFQSLCCAVKHNREDKTILPDATITSFSASWILEDCELRAVHAPVLRLLDDANTTLLSCNIGGVGGSGDSADDDLMRATDAVVANRRSNVLLYRCRIEDTGDADSRPPRDLRGNIIVSAQPCRPMGMRAIHPYNGKSGFLMEI